MSQVSFAAACRTFFGLLPGQTLGEFGVELKTLTNEDRIEIAEGLRANGMDCADPIMR